MAGAFITLEGIEGVGKSTNLAYLKERLISAGQQVLVTREPGGTELGELIRKWILEDEHKRSSPEVEVLLMFAARAHHLDEVIRPALKEGAWILCDRFTDATIAYQGAGRGASIAMIDDLKRHVQQGLEPDLTLLFDAPVEIGFSRIADRAPDNFEREEVAFYENVRSSYLELADRYPDRIKRIDASASLHSVRQQIDHEVDLLRKRLVANG
jgi:dTMP kinase